MATVRVMTVVSAALYVFNVAPAGAAGLCTTTGATNPCVPGGKRASGDCFMEFAPQPVPPRLSNQMPQQTLICYEGDPRCDADPVLDNNICTLQTRLCINNHDPRLRCTPADIATFEVRSPLPRSINLYNQINLQTLEQQGGAAGFGVSVYRGKTLVSTGTPNGGADTCSDLLPIQVPQFLGDRGTYRTGKRTLRLKVTTSGGAVDTDTLNLQCRVNTCGDGQIQSDHEECDQGGGNRTNGDGCDAGCHVEPGWGCSGSPSVCALLTPTPTSTPSPTPTPTSPPTLEGPVTGGNGAPFVAGTTFDLATVGYGQTEYFMSGTAHAYTNVGPLGTNGKWTVTTGDTAAYKTRLLVYRPLDASRFNGTVVVEWLNVSGGLDAAADWIMMHTELIRDGYAWVGVSAQVVGVEGGAALLGIVSLPLKTVDPARYGSLVHPGDSFSYDIFTQAGQAIRHPFGPDPLGGLHPDAVIAAGESQAAFRFVTYINAVQPVAGAYDGFLVHSRGGSNFAAAALSQSPQPAIAVPPTSLIRDDINVPVLNFETETDITFLGYAGVQQDDSEHFRLWEVAGTSHADTYTIVTGMTDDGNSPDAANLVITTVPTPGVSCPAPINSGPQHFVLNAAMAALNHWVRDGTAPPTVPRLTLNNGSLVRDANGNALGGVRTPQVDVPIAAFSGEPQFGSLLCLVFGRTTPFDGATLTSLYPTHDAYVAAYDAATDQAVQAGFILQPDADLMKAAAAASGIGN